MSVTSSRAVSTCAAPRTCRSAVMASRRSEWRPVRKRRAPYAANTRAVSAAIAEVAPTIRTRRPAGSGVVDTAPEGGGELGVDMDREPLPLREEPAEALRAHAGILGGVDRSARISYHSIELLEQREGAPATEGEVHRQGEPRPGEGEQAGGRHVPESLEHRQGGSLTRTGHALEDLANHPAARQVRDDALVLQEAIGPVQSTPVADGVQREEERRIGDHGPGAGADLAPIVQLVE